MRYATVIGIPLLLATLIAGCGDEPSPMQPQSAAHTSHGAAVASMLGCFACHTDDGDRSIGPTFLNLYGSERRLANGRTVTADDHYLRESTIEHSATIVEGYANVGPSYSGRITVEQIEILTTWLESLSRHTTTEESTEDPAESGEPLNPPTTDPG